VVKLVEILIPKTYFIGIDESNHGKYPEIYVAALSPNEREIIPSSTPLPKIRSKKSLETIVSGLDDYKYMKLSRRTMDFYGKLSSLKSQVISTILVSFELNPSRMIVYIDGGGSLEFHENILSLFNSNQSKGNLLPQNLQFAIHGDQIYPIINKADRLAYKIFREVERNPNYKLQKRYVSLPLRC